MARKKNTDAIHSLRTAGTMAHEAMRITTAANQLAVASRITIGHRLPQFWGAAFGLPGAQAEVRHAIVEKMAATMETQVATGFAMMELGFSFATGGTSQANFKKAADIAHAAMAPSSRRAKANATRLGRENR